MKRRQKSARRSWGEVYESCKLLLVWIHPFNLKLYYKEVSTGGDDGSVAIQLNSVSCFQSLILSAYSEAGSVYEIYENSVEYLLVNWFYG